MKLRCRGPNILFCSQKFRLNENNCVKHTPHTNLDIESVSFFFMLGTNAALNHHAIIKQVNKNF